MIPFREKTPKHSSDIRECKHYSSYKDKLKDDFNSRCGYCDDKSIGVKNFVIDHFVPQNPDNFKHTIKPNLYTNLIYSCPFCNSFKSNKWPTNDENIHHNEHVGFIKPTEKEYTNLFSRDSKGRILPTENKIAKYIYDELKLFFPIHELNWKFEKLKYQEELLKDLISETQDESLKSELLAIRSVRLSIMDEILSICNG